MTRLERAVELLRRARPLAAGLTLGEEIDAWLAEEEAPTQPAIRRSSDKLPAVTLPEPGLAERVAEELRKGKR